MRSGGAISLLFASVLGATTAMAAECPGNPNALGVSRTIVVDPAQHTRLGSLQYRETLPLNDKEVVLTFDDGPLPPYTSRILDTLASECVKATFFMVGRMVRGYPSIVQRVYAEGHTIANHSMTHPFNFQKMSVDQAAKEIEGGYQSLLSVLGDPNKISPFFRIPGLLRQESVENYLASRDMMAWSVDFVADDWTHISAHEIVRRAVNRIEARGRGILLLHDIQPATALGLPDLLRELKARGFKIVQVVPATADRPATFTEPQQWAARHGGGAPSYWPSNVVVGLDTSSEPALEAPSPQSFGVARRPAMTSELVPAARVVSGEAAAPIVPVWPRVISYPQPLAEEMPVPAAQNFRYSRIWRAVHTPPATHKTAVARKGKPAAAKLAARPAEVPAVQTAHSQKPASRKRVGHQLTFPSKPTAGKPTASLMGTVFGQR